MSRSVTRSRTPAPGTALTRDTVPPAAALSVFIPQRPYGWNQDDNWSALWEDTRRCAERAEQAAPTGETVAPHFLGAVVFDETPYLSSGLETRQVIDGQQRLTTLQLFLFAARLELLCRPLLLCTGLGRLQLLRVKDAGALHL